MYIRPYTCLSYMKRGVHPQAAVDTFNAQMQGLQPRGGSQARKKQSAAQMQRSVARTHSNVQQYKKLKAWKHTFGQLRCASSATMRALRRTPSLLSSVAACVCALHDPLFLSSSALRSLHWLLQTRDLATQ